MIIKVSTVPDICQQAEPVDRIIFDRILEDCKSCLRSQDVVVCTKWDHDSAKKKKKCSTRTGDDAFLSSLVNAPLMDYCVGFQDHSDHHCGHQRHHHFRNCTLYCEPDRLLWQSWGWAEDRQIWTNLSFWLSWSINVGERFKSVPLW